MNESELENELRILRPTAPPDDLVRRIERDLLSASLEPSSPQSVVRSKPANRGFISGLERLFWAAAGAAAAVTIMHRAPLPPQGPSTAEQKSAATKISPAKVTPVLHEEEIAETDEGVSFYQAGTPVKKLRRVVLERQSWADAKGGTLEIQWPREDFIFVPVEQQ